MIELVEKGGRAEPLIFSAPPDVVTSKDVDHLKAFLRNLGG
jgi:hypothetical protein